MIDLARLRRLPLELRARAQWALAGASKAPLSIDAKGNLYHTSVNRPSEWLSFEHALTAAERFAAHVSSYTDKKGRVVTQTGLNLGYVLNESDPLACIDLDVKDQITHPDEPELWTSPDRFDLFWNIAQTFDTYTELSRSGKGLHLWALGKIGPGFKRDGVEVYSQERFIICTGSVVIDNPLRERQAMLDNMVSQMRPIPSTFNLEELPPEVDDWYIFNQAVNAANSAKFTQLWKGEWKEMGFPSQSEADLALMSMLSFYSASNEQCRRLFRESALGKREKAQKDDRYINLTLSVIRERQWRETRADISAIVQSTTLAHQSRQIVSLQAPLAPTDLPVQPAAQPAPVVAAALAPSGNAPEDSKGLAWPPGFTGHIARFIYQSAPRPVKEVAIVAAVGLLAGITGKAWHIPQSGLNLYIVLIARSAIGKEAMHSGISAIIKACTKENPLFHKFVDFTEYASGPALIKACAANPCFLNVSGEWGKRLARLAAEDGRDGALQTLRTQMTNLYQKSGPAAIVGGIGYSKTDDNIASVAGVSYSMIGETTPGTFYRALTDTMMEDGFLSRFLTVEYKGHRPPENEQRIEYPDAATVKALNSLATHADLLIGRDQSMPVARESEVAEVMKQFDLECDTNINSTNDEARRQMWNRAALKSLRLAAILAVADNWMAPCITLEQIRWAQMIIRNDISIMRQRLDSGDVGVDDTSRERKLVAIMKEYLENAPSASYKVSEAMRANGIVPRSYLQIRVNKLPAFSSHRMGSSRAIDESVQTLVNNGYLMETQKDKIIDAYNYHGKAYRILRLPAFDE